ncbi:hypothetical protein HD554DRAFT_2171964 [Boletus coccyginus]|nr:hypothetical protein HD554DRAFT_2171964 [Boletus coccyginus]
MSQDPYLPVLNQFACKVWGNPGAVLKQHPGGFQFIDLGPYFDAFRSLFAGVALPDKLLVRDEYRIALQALEEDRYKQGAYVVGQPGIGKTLFLVYVLVVRLGQKQSVALQFIDGFSFYALFKDNVEFHPLNHLAPLFRCPFVWALCDSNDSVKSPSPIFLGKVNIRVIQTTSPKSSRWKEWSKQAGAWPYVMDIFSDEEVVHLATLLGLDVLRMTTLSRNWGNVARTLMKYVDTEDSTVEGNYYDDAGRAVQKSKTIIDGGSRFDFPDGSPSSFYFLRPMKTSTGTINRLRGSVSVPTQTLCRLLAKALQDQDNHVKLQFYNALSHHGNTRQAAGYIFESWFHNFFLQELEMDCHWVMRRSGDDAGPPTLSMPAHAKLIPSTKTAPSSAIPPYYWVAYKPNFAGIDSALVLEDRIFAFQMTLGSNHRSPMKGLRDLRDLLPRDLKDLPWRVVFVGPEDGPIKAVAKHWDGKLSFPTNKDSVPVGWSALDPAQGGVTYKESEELMEVDDEGEAPTPIDA